MPYAGLAICGLHDVHETVDESEATHLLSMLDHGTPMPAHADISGGRHLQMFFSDTDDRADSAAPSLEDMHEIHDWAIAVPLEARLVVHCYMGISRSTAVTLGLLARHLPPLDAARRLLAIRPQATPNRLIVAHWDEILGMQGALEEAANLFPLPFWASDDWR